MAICRCVLFTLFVLEADGPLWSWASAGPPALAAFRLAGGPSSDAGRMIPRNFLVVRILPHCYISARWRRSHLMHPGTTHGDVLAMTSSKGRPVKAPQMARRASDSSWRPERRALHGTWRGDHCIMPALPANARTIHHSDTPQPAHFFLVLRGIRGGPVPVDRSLPRCCHGFPDSS